MQLIVGLGNPGPEYENTRHNIGFALIKRLAERHNLPQPEPVSDALVSRGRIAGCSVLVAQPLVYMNKSGRAVKTLCRRYNLSCENLLVVHDDLDLEPGRLRFRGGGSAGGHRGVKSIMRETGTQDFARLKIGIGHPGDTMPPADYVLETFSPSEWELMDRVLGSACEGVCVFLQEGLTEAMNRVNGLRFEQNK